MSKKILIKYFIIFNFLNFTSVFAEVPSDFIKNVTNEASNILKKSINPE